MNNPCCYKIGMGYFKDILLDCYCSRYIRPHHIILPTWQGVTLIQRHRNKERTDRQRKQRPRTQRTPALLLIHPSWYFLLAKCNVECRIHKTWWEGVMSVNLKWKSWHPPFQKKSSCFPLASFPLEFLLYFHSMSFHSFRQKHATRTLLEVRILPFPISKREETHYFHSVIQEANAKN